MGQIQEITDLKLRYAHLEERMHERELNSSSSIVELSQRLLVLIENISSTQEKQKSTWNPALETRIKFMKKGVKLGKKLNYFDIEIAKEFKSGNLSKDTVEKFVSIILLIKENKISKAKSEFAYFEDIIELNKKYDSAKNDLEKKDGDLRREIKRTKKLLSEISEMDKISFDPKKVQMHKNLLKQVRVLEELRANYLSSLVSKPSLQLLVDLENAKLLDKLPNSPTHFEISQLRDFFSQYRELDRYNVSQICELFNYSEKRLSHIIPETNLFRKTVFVHQKWFETMNSVDQTSFLAVDIENDSVLDFFAQNINGAKKIVGEIRQIREQQNSFKVDYEKNKKFQERKKELSIYSKNKLEAELAEYESLLELLNSKIEEEKKEEPGLFSRIKSFFN